MANLANQFVTDLHTFRVNTPEKQFDKMFEMQKISLLSNHLVSSLR